MKSSENLKDIKLYVFPAEKLPIEYHQYLMAQEIQKSIFLNSIKNLKYDQTECYSVLKVRSELDMTLFDELTVCGKMVSEVGCGIFATVQALYYEPKKEDVQKVIKTIEENNYYIPGKGLRWCWFDNFCRRPNHWLEVINSMIYQGNPVTVLLERDKTRENSRNLFTNLVGYYLNDNKEPIFSTTEGNNISLTELSTKLVTAPWIYCI